MLCSNNGFIRLNGSTPESFEESCKAVFAIILSEDANDSNSLFIDKSLVRGTVIYMGNEENLEEKLNYCDRIAMAAYRLEQDENQSSSYPRVMYRGEEFNQYAPRLHLSKDEITKIVVCEICEK